MQLNELLDCFSGQELARALAAARLPSSGNKDEKISRLCQLPAPVAELLDLFTADAIREACFELNKPVGRKPEMIAELAPLVSDAMPTATAAELVREPLPPAIPAIAKTRATREAVIDALRRLSLPRRRVQDEFYAQEHIVEHLRTLFEDDIVYEYNIGGYLALKIDIDIGNGELGVEVKFANPLSATELQRLIGQAIYYRHRRYQDRLIIAIAGHPEDLQDPALKETCAVLEAFNIPCVHIPLV